MKAKTLWATLLMAGALISPWAAAQTATKPLAKPATPADGGKTLSISGKSSAGPLLTRDELRACFSQEESIRTRIAALDARRAPLDQEKANLATEQQALRTEREPIDAFKKTADDLGARLKDYATRVQAWNDKVAAFNASPPKGTAFERQRNDINNERAALEVQQKELETEKAKLGSDSEAAVKNYNTKAVTLDGRVTDWNQRNESWNKDSKALEAERATWVTSCSDRRYREDDEIAIRKGK
jgi:chromosome segregation ATPase